MVISVIVCILSCAGLIASVLFKPSVKIGKGAVSIYWIPPVAGGLILLLSGTLGAREAWAGLTASGT